VKLIVVPFVTDVHPEQVGSAGVVKLGG